MIQSFDLLDLTIALTPPPENAPADAIASMVLRCEALGLNHMAGLLIDPLTPQERTDLRWYLEEYSQWPYAEFAERGKRIEAQLSEIGKRLYQTAFGAVMGQVQPWRLLPTKQRQISIVSTIPAALSLPWELLHDEQGFLVLRTRQPVTLLRRLEQHELSELPMTFKPPLRVLVVTARPSGTGFLDPRSLARELLDAVQPQIDAGTIEVEFLRPPTRKALRQRLAQSKQPVHIFHFDGHGVFNGKLDPQDDQRKQGGTQGMLAFEDVEGNLDLVKAEDLGQLLQDSGVKLAVLDACQSAMSAADDAFSSVAARLIKSGVDATIAMSANVLVVTSTRFFATFYRELAAGTPAPIAQERARQDLYDDPRRHLFRRRADEEGQPVELRDWWLPHFYQQRPLILRSTKTPRTRKMQPPARARFNDAMPSEPRYRFSGRARELLQIERHLLHKRLIVLSGFGGVGKTALVREAADWLTRIGLYTSACFVSFEHGGDATMLLSELGTFLGVNDESYTPNDPVGALARLQSALQACPTLVIADNLESLLPTGEVPLELAAREQLWSILRKLTTLHAGVLLTTRDPSFGDDQLAPSAYVAHLPLRGLSPHDAYALASSLLEGLTIPRTCAPYAELYDLLAQLDYYPLALQLVLPTLRERPLDTIRTNFAALLPTFVDNTATGNNRSLQASLDYSLRRLTDAQRTWLPRLAPFEGGAFELDLLTITEIPESDWSALRQALEQTALLTSEPTAPFFLRFHPVLAPYLRSQLGATADPVLRERFAWYYANAARLLYLQDNQHPQAIRTLAQLQLPNLRGALTYYLEAGDLETAALLADHMIRFLTNFGRWRERDEVRRRVAAAVIVQQTTAVPGELTKAEFLQESGLGEEELEHGNFRAAATRLTRLLTRIEALPAAPRIGRGSYEHAKTLLHLAQCSAPEVAEKHLRQALVFTDALLQRQPEEDAHYQGSGSLENDEKDKEKNDAEAHKPPQQESHDENNHSQETHYHYQHLRACLLGSLADALSHQGQYSQAHDAYTQALEIDQHIGNPRGVAVIEAELGTLAFEQGDYAEARARFLVALHTFQALDEPRAEAQLWRRLGMVAQEHQQWSEAEHYYRTSLTIHERLGDAAGAASTCNQLGNVARLSGRTVEAEGWYRRALPNPHCLHNLADLLVNEVRAGRASTERLAEARYYIEQSLAIEDTREASGKWDDFYLLAEIANLEGQPEVAQYYRRREYETYAAFAGNRYHIDRENGLGIAAIAAAARGDTKTQKAIEAAFPQIEAEGCMIAAATRRIWAGERDWHALVEGIDRESALLILRVLETLAATGEVSAPSMTQTLLGLLPASVREAIEQQDQTAFVQALAALAPEEQQRVQEALQELQELDDASKPEQGV